MKSNKLSTKVFKFLNTKTKETYFTEAYSQEDALRTLAIKLNANPNDFKKVVATPSELQSCWKDKTKKCYTVVVEETLTEDDFIKKKKIEHATKELRNIYDLNMRKQYFSSANDIVKLKTEADGHACYNTGWTLTPSKVTDENGVEIDKTSIFRFKSEKDMFDKIEILLCEANAFDIPFNKDLTCREAFDYITISKQLNYKTANA